MVFCNKFSASPGPGWSNITRAWRSSLKVISSPRSCLPLSRVLDATSVLQAVQHFLGKVMGMWTLAKLMEDEYKPTSHPSCEKARPSLLPPG